MQQALHSLVGWPWLQLYSYPPHFMLLHMPISSRRMLASQRNNQPQQTWHSQVNAV
jgi:hypothetical protein